MSQAMRNSASEIEAMCAHLKSLTHTTVTLPEAHQFLLVNPNEINKYGTGIYMKKRLDIQQFYTKEVKTRPIRRCDIRPSERESATTVLDRFKVSKQWSETVQRRLVLMWELYTRDRESLFH